MKLIAAIMVLFSNGATVFAKNCEYSAQVRGDRYDHDTIAAGQFGVQCDHVVKNKWRVRADLVLRTSDDSTNRTFTKNHVGAVLARELSVQRKGNVYTPTIGIVNVSKQNGIITTDVNPWINPWERHDLSRGPIEAAINDKSIGAPGVIVSRRMGSFSMRGYAIDSNQQVLPVKSPWSVHALTGVPVKNSIKGKKTTTGIILASDGSRRTGWNIGIARGSTGSVTGFMVDEAKIVPSTKRVTSTHAQLRHEFDSGITMRSGIRHDSDDVTMMNVEAEKLFDIAGGNLYVQTGLGYTQGCDHDSAALDLRCFYREATFVGRSVYATDTWEYSATMLAAVDSGKALNVKVSRQFSRGNRVIEASIGGEWYFGDTQTNLGKFKDQNRVTLNIELFF